MRITCAHDEWLVSLTSMFISSFFPVIDTVELDVMLTISFFNSPISNRPRETSRALSRKSQNMTCVPSTVVLWRHDTDAGVNQNKNAGSGGDGEDDDE
jgi:hypothetical protein